MNIVLKSLVSIFNWLSSNKNINKHLLNRLNGSKELYDRYQKNYVKSWKELDYYNTLDSTYIVIIHEIEESSMCNPSGMLDIYKSDRLAVPLFSLHRYVSCLGKENFQFFPELKIFVFKLWSHQKNSQKGSLPFLIVNLELNQFSFIEWNSTSIYYKLNINKEGEISILEDDMQNINRLKKDKLDFLDINNVYLNLKNLKWYEFSQIDNITDIYNKSLYYENIFLQKK